MINQGGVREDLNLILRLLLSGDITKELTERKEPT